MRRGRRAIAAAVFAAVLCAPAAHLAGQQETLPADLNEIARQCDERNRVLGGNNNATSSALDNIEAMLGETEKAATKAPALATAAAGQPPAQTFEDAKTAIEATKLRVQISESLRTQAAQEMSAARAERDPAKKVEHYKTALRQLREAEAQGQRAAATLAPPALRGQSFHPHSETLDRLEAVVRAIKEGAPVTPTLGRMYEDTQRSRQAVGTAASTSFFTGGPAVYAGGAVTVGGGRRIDVSALERAAAAPGQPRRPLIIDVPAPPGYGRAQHVDPGVYNRARAAAPQVGGVALDVTFLALEAAGVDGFRGGEALEAVDQAVMISLRTLLARVRPYAALIWDRLPEDLRFPGGIERVHGFVLDRARGDVILVGVPARRPEARLDIDSLVLGLRASWRDDATAYVSLDPSPLDPFGPQISRVGGVPNDSVPAKIMLTADYMMKEIMLGKRRTDVPGYRSAVQLVRERPDGNVMRSRFWFYPRPLGPQAVLTSVSGRTTMFNAELQVLTEQMAIQGGAVMGTGTRGDTAETAAAEFTRSLDRFAVSVTTDPQAGFARLRGLTSVATLGALLRKSRIAYPVLKQVSELPYRRLGAAEAAPKQYPGLVTQFDVRRDGKLWRISLGGGVELVPRPRRTSREAAIEKLAAHFERAADRGDFQGADFVAQPLPAVFTRTDTGGADARADALMLEGTDAFRRGQFDVAAQRFRASTQIDPSLVDAYVNLAFALDRLGRGKEAREAIHVARLLDPEDSAAKLIEFAIRSRTERAWPGLGDPRRSVRELVGLYTANARHALYLKNEAQAYAWANDAIAFGLDQAAVEAYLVRGLARRRQAPDAACADIHRAWDETQYVLSGGSYDDDAKLHALASIGLSECALDRVARTLASGKIDRAFVRALAEDSTRAIDAVRPVQKLFPGLSTVFALTVELEALRYDLLEPVLPADVKAREAARLLGVADDVVRKFPDAPAARAARANVLALSGRCAEARAEMAKARRDPTFSEWPGAGGSPCGAL